MLRAGITGGIGSGKSVVAKAFAALGIAVYHADEQAKWLMNHDVLLKQQLSEVFGADVYENDLLNRTRLASLVFGNPVRLSQLNGLVHPRVLAHTAEWVMQQSSPYVMKEAAIFFESGSAAGIDFMIGVYAPKALRLQRAMHRDGLSRKQVLERMDKQLDEEIKMKLCDAVIINNDQQMILPQVLAFHEKLLDLSTGMLLQSAQHNS